MNELCTATKPMSGDLPKRLRKRAGMTQDDLAAATGFRCSLIGKSERKRR